MFVLNRSLSACRIRTIRRSLFSGLSLVAWFSLSPALSAVTTRVSILDFGAIADGTTVNTGAVQRTIDAVANKGGGTVVFPAGVFLSGALFLKPGVNLHLEKDAVLKATTDMAHFPPRRTRIEGHFEESFTPALINADACDGLKITGEGTLDGDGRVIWDEFWKQRKASKDPKNFKNLGILRARLCLIENSDGVLIQGVTFKDSQFWNLHLYKNRNVTVEKVRFQVPDNYKQAPSSDGIDIDSCQDVTIRGCEFSVTDDCIALKGSKGPDALEDTDSPPVERVRIENCVFRRGHAAVTCGSEATVVRDVAVEGGRVMGAMPLLLLKLRPDTPQRYEKITVRDVTMDSRAARLLTIDRWTQYFDLKGRPEPRSVVDRIRLSGIRGRVGSLGVIRGNEGTEFGEIVFEDIAVEAKSAELKAEGVGILQIRNVLVNGEVVAGAGN